jgi:hypothetical protein
MNDKGIKKCRLCGLTTKQATDKLLDLFSVKGSLLVPTTLMRIHPELTYDEAESLMEFAKSKTIIHEECYGDGSIIYPMWEEAKCC